MYVSVCRESPLPTAIVDFRRKRWERRRTTEGRCGELVKYWVRIETAQISVAISRWDNNCERSITPFVIVRNLGSILPEVIAGVAPAATSKSGPLQGGTELKSPKHLLRV